MPSVIGSSSEAARALTSGLEAETGPHCSPDGWPPAWAAEFAVGHAECDAAAVRLEHDGAVVRECGGQRGCADGPVHWSRPLGRWAG